MRSKPLTRLFISMCEEISETHRIGNQFKYQQIILYIGQFEKDYIKKERTSKDFEAAAANIIAILSNLYIFPSMEFGYNVRESLLLKEMALYLEFLEGGV